MPVIDWTVGEKLNKACVLWDNYGARPGSTVTFDGELPEHPAINTIDPATYNYWQAGGAPSARVRYNYAQPFPVDAVGIAAHTIGTSGATIGIEATVNGSTWSTIGTYTPMTDADLMFLIPRNNYRGVAINFSVAAPTVGVVFSGTRLNFPCTPIDNYKPTQHARMYDKVFTKSLKGQFLGNRVMGAGGQTEVSFPEIQRNFVDGPLVGFEDHYNRGGMFFYAGWPGGKPQDMAYCRAPSMDATVDVNYTNGSALATLSFGLETYVGA